MEGVAEQARIEPANHAALIAQLEGDRHNPKSNLDFPESLNIVADLQYSKLSNDCCLLKRHFVGS